jgi:hypothetical protein
VRIKSILELKKMLEDMGFKESAEDLLKVSCKTLRNQIRKLSFDISSNKVKLSIKPLNSSY